MDESARQLELVRLTFRNGLRNCVHWQASVLSRVIRDPQLAALGAPGTVSLLFDWVNLSGGVRPAAVHGSDSVMPYDYLFEVVVGNIDSVPNGLYVKLGLKNDDVEYPEVNIVSCHVATFPEGLR